MAVASLLTAVGVVAAPPHPSADGINMMLSLEAPPTLAWEAPVPADRPTGRLDAEVVDGVLVLTSDAAVAGHDLFSGERLWEVVLDGGRCTYQDEVVCVVGRDSSTLVVTIEARTGRVEVRPLPEAAWALTVGDDVVALLYSERTQSVVRIGEDDVVRWRTEVPYQPGIGGGAARGYPFASIEDLLFVGTAGPAILDLATGETLARPLLMRYDRSGIFGLGFDETWWHLWSGERVPLPEGAALLGVDDDLGGVTDVLVSAATGITLLQEGKDEPHWSGEWSEEPLARLSGVLVTSDDRNLLTTGVDLATGALLWTTEPLTCPCLGAGDVLLLTGSQTVPSGLTAIDVHSGHPVWQLAFPPGSSLVRLIDGGVLVATADTVLLYRW